MISQQRYGQPPPTALAMLWGGRSLECNIKHGAGTNWGTWNPPSQLPVCDLMIASRWPLGEEEPAVRQCKKPSRSLVHGMICPRRGIRAGWESLVLAILYSAHSCYLSHIGPLSGPRRSILSILPMNRLDKLP